MRSLIFSVNSLFGQCLSYGLAGLPGVDFVLHSADLDEVVVLARRHDASSVLIDLGDEAGILAVKALSRTLAGTCLLALSVNDREASMVIECAKLGCHGIVPRDATLDDVVRIIQAAERGEAVMHPRMIAQLMHALADEVPDESRGLPECLTRREREICALLCEGLTNKEIAREVNRSVGTVKNHVHSILSKLELPRRSAIHTCLYQAGPRQNISR